MLSKISNEARNELNEQYYKRESEMILWFYALLFLIVLQAIKFFIYYQLIINNFSLKVYIYIHLKFQLIIYHIL